jgi:macrolide transport system ATP-binding/permease protein
MPRSQSNSVLETWTHADIWVPFRFSERDAFAFVDTAWIKPLSYRDPSRLVSLYEPIVVGGRYHVSNFDYLEWKRLNRSLSSLDAYRPDSFAPTSATTPEAVSEVQVRDVFMCVTY